MNEKYSILKKALRSLLIIVFLEQARLTSPNMQKHNDGIKKKGCIAIIYRMWGWGMQLAHWSLSTGFHWSSIIYNIKD